MTNYICPEIIEVKPLPANTAVLIASGDLRLSANQKCWAAQVDMENNLRTAFEIEGMRIVRGHDYDPVENHGFISSQRMGIEVFKSIHPESPLIVAEAAPL